MHCISTDFGVDSSSRFPFRARTVGPQTDTIRQSPTQLISVPTHLTFEVSTDTINFISYVTIYYAVCFRVISSTHIANY